MVIEDLNSGTLWGNQGDTQILHIAVAKFHAQRKIIAHDACGAFHKEVVAFKT
ncbi:Uncharacterised protein [Vibrio cholerae]|nr:Uncharacterised protein [Vibrio cholerae]